MTEKQYNQERKKLISAYQAEQKKKDTEGKMSLDELFKELENLQKAYLAKVDYEEYQSAISMEANL